MFLGPVGSYEILIRLKQNEKQLKCNMYNVYVYTLQYKIYWCTILSQINI